jgi:hypothetical protein
MNQNMALRSSRQNSRQFADKKYLVREKFQFSPLIFASVLLAHKINFELPQINLAIIFCVS